LNVVSVRFPRRLSLGIAALALGFPGCAPANSGEGDFPLANFHPLEKFVHPQPLSVLGYEAVRFTADPALGGRVLVVEIAHQDPKWATGKVYFLFRNRKEVRLDGQLKISLSRSDFDSLMSQIVRLAEPAVIARSPNGADNICTDGPGYVAEFRHAGKSHWIGHECGEDATFEIAKLMARVIEANIGEYTRHLGGDAHPFDPAGR